MLYNKRISDLRNGNIVLDEISCGNPIYLTNYGRDDSTITNRKELDKLYAINVLYCALEKGETSAKEKDWIARRGRQRFTGERSIGTYDPGIVAVGEMAIAISATLK